MEKEERYVDNLYTARRIGLLVEGYDGFLISLGNMRPFEEWPSRELQEAYEKIGMAVMNAIEAEARYITRPIEGKQATENEEEGVKENE